MKPRLKRLTGVIFWIGILCACMPLLMRVFGNARQWQLQKNFVKSNGQIATGTTSVRDDEPDDGLIRLNIPKLHLEAMVVGGVTEAALASGPGHWSETAMPGQPGNCGIVAHRNMWGCWFARLDELHPGDLIRLETAKRHFVYRVTKSEIRDPEDMSVLHRHGNKRELTLVTCTLPPTHRIIVHSILDNSSTSA